MLEPEGEKMRRGLVLNITGNGKGKTTSALGTALRALGWGQRVVIIQFVKGGFDTGEKRFFDKFGPQAKFITEGKGYTWTAGITAEQHAAAVLKAWETAKTYLCDPTVDLLILDELNAALQLAPLTVAEVTDCLRQRPPEQHVIITGRGAPESLLAAADLVSEIREVKHPLQHGITAQKGIEY